MILFYNYKLYGDAFLQLYFLLTSIYGWYYWIKRKEDKKTPIVLLNKLQFAAVLAICIILSAIAGLILDKFTNSDVPYIDGMCTAISFVAQFLMTRKILQNWILWIIVDICFIPLYIFKDLALTAVLYTLYLILATIGYLNWKQTWKQTL